MFILYYSAEYEKRKQHNNLPALYPDLPENKYDIIYADPSWDYNGKMQFDKSCKMSENIDWQKNIFISAANFKYPTLKIDVMKKISIQTIC